MTLNALLLRQQILLELYDELGPAVKEILVDGVASPDESAPANEHFEVFCDLLASNVPNRVMELLESSW